MTDRQTDGQMHNDSIYYASIASRGANWWCQPWVVDIPPPVVCKVADSVANAEGVSVERCNCT